MNNNVLLIAAGVGAALFLMGRKNAIAAAQSAPIASKNLNSDMWSRILGDGWRNLVNAQNDDGSRAFVMKNRVGQIVTSDGVPISSGDAIGDWLQATLGFSDQSAAPAVDNGYTGLFPLTSSIDPFQY